MLRDDGQGALLHVRVSPRSSKNAVAGFKNNRLLIAVRAAPQKGEANAAVVEVLSAILSLAKSNLEIVRGHKSREKTVRIVGMSAAQITQKLSAS